MRRVQTHGGIFKRGQLMTHQKSRGVAIDPAILVDYQFAAANSRRIVDSSSYSRTGWSFKYILLAEQSNSGKSLLVGTGHAQGYAFDGTNHYITSTTGIGKWNNDFSTQLASNSSPFTSLSGSPDHLGGCEYYNGYLYVIAAQYTSCISNGDAQIVRYDPTTLALVDTVDISASVPGSASGLAINTDDGLIYLSDFCQLRTVYECSLSTRAYASDLTLDTDALNANGIAYYDGQLYINGAAPGAPTNPQLHQFDKNGAFVLTMDYPNTNVPDNGCYVSANIFRGVSYQTDFEYEYDLGPQNAAGEWDGLNNGVTQAVQVPLTMPDEGTIDCTIIANRLFNFNSIWASEVGANDWEAWIYSDGRTGWRIANTGSSCVSGTGAITASGEHRIIFTWAGSGATRTCNLYIDGSLVSGPVVQNWIAPSSRFFLAGYPLNNGGECTYKAFTVYSDVRPPV